MKLFFLLSLFMLSLPAFAMKATSGAQLCGKKATLYAFYEGAKPQLHNIQLWKEDKKLTRQQWLDRAYAHFNQATPKLAVYIKPKIEQVLQLLPLSFATKFLSPVSDQENDVVFVDKNCSYRPVAFWFDQAPFPTIDEKLFKRLSPMGQAGLIFEQAFYKFVREVSDKPSADDTRYWVAKIFSDESLINSPYKEGMTQEQKIEASRPFCSKALNLLSKQIKLYVESYKLCLEERDSTSLGLVQTTKKMILETVRDCQNECLWDEGIKTCESYEKLVKDYSSCG